VEFVINLIVKVYTSYPIPSRIAVSLWIALLIVYGLLNWYEHAQGQIKKGTYTRFNNPRTTWIIIIVMYLVEGYILNSGISKYPGIWNPIFMFSFGVALMIGGLVLAASGRICLNGYWKSDIYDYGSNNKLIEDGIYARMRHPIYTGQFLMLVGNVVLANIHPLFFIAAILLLIVNWIRAHRETKDLERRFPNEFPKYKEKVPAWWPF